MAREGAIKPSGRPWGGPGKSSSGTTWVKFLCAAQGVALGRTDHHLSQSCECDRSLRIRRYTVFRHTASSADGVRTRVHIPASHNRHRVEVPQSPVKKCATSSRPQAVLAGSGRAERTSSGRGCSPLAIRQPGSCEGPRDTDGPVVGEGVVGTTPGAPGATTRGAVEGTTPGATGGCPTGHVRCAVGVLCGGDVGVGIGGVVGVGDTVGRSAGRSGPGGGLRRPTGDAIRMAAITAATPNPLLAMAAVRRRCRARLPAVSRACGVRRWGGAGCARIAAKVDGRSFSFMSHASSRQFGGAVEGFALQQLA
jgi:hypothetical protein